MAESVTNREIVLISNGFTVGYEYIEKINSFNIGLFFKVGAKDEPDRLNGITHFIEHLLFKGTEHYSNKELLYKIEGLGGDFDAYTDYEGVTITIRILKKYWREAIQIIFDIMKYPLFAEKDIEAERSVVLEEISMYYDSPQDALYQFFLKNFWSDAPYGRTILGEEEILKGITRDDIYNYYHKYFVPQNCIISIAGDIEKEQIYEEIEKYSFTQGEKIESENSAIYGHFNFFHKQNRELKQSHIILNFPSVNYLDETRFSFYILNTILGASDFSLLSQSIREERGLAYNLYSDLIMFKNSGTFLFYVGYNPKRQKELFAGLGEIFEQIRNGKIDESIFNVAKNYVMAKLLFALDSVQTIMEKNGISIRKFGKFTDYNELMRKIENITLKDIEKLVDLYLFSGKVGLTYYGALEKEKVEKEWNKLRLKFIEMRKGSV